MSSVLDKPSSSSAWERGQALQAVADREMLVWANSFPRLDLEEAAFFAAIPPAVETAETFDPDPYDFKRERDERIDRDYERAAEAGR